jgi:hypothetical protein
VIRSEKEPGNPGSFILGLLPGATVCHLFLAQNWNVFWNVFFRTTIHYPKYERESVWTNGREEVSRRETERVFRAKGG